MLVNPKEYLVRARREGWALGGFNVYNLESARAVIEAGAETAAPLLVQVSEGAVKNNGELLDSQGFYLSPSDRDTNNEMVYIPKSALKELTILGIEKPAEMTARLLTPDSSDSRPLALISTSDDITLSLASVPAYGVIRILLRWKSK